MTIKDQANPSDLTLQIFGLDMLIRNTLAYH
jgi:hypothetical protein